MVETLNITAIVPYPVYPAKMGGQKGIALFYQYLGEAIPVTIITTGKQQPINFKGRFLPILGSSKLRYINPFLFFRIRNTLLQQHATHLILEHPYFGWLGVMLKRSCNIPLIVHSHNIESLRFKSTGKWWWKILWKYERYTHKNADINFFITDEDRHYAVENFKLNPVRCHTITYGFELNSYPSIEEKLVARKKIQQKHNILETEKILFFNGTLDYKPNLDAVDVILNQINPLLLKTPGFKYTIIICGKHLPGKYENLKNYESKNIIYAGFVDEISDYFKAADVFINPVTDGGGIKTKLVEALGYNVSSISTLLGATGIPLHITGNKLLIEAGTDWNAFTQKILSIDNKENITPAFFYYFYWGNIAKKAVEIIKMHHS